MDAYPESAKKLRLSALHLAMIRAPQLVYRYFEMKLPDPQMEAAIRRGLTPNKRGFLGRGAEAEGISERSSVLSVGTRSPRSKEDTAQARQALVRSQSALFDSALRNLGKRSSTQHREFHGIMRAINGGAKLRGFARDQRFSEDPDMRTHASEALNVAGDEGRLILDEGGDVVDSEGQSVHVEMGETENPAVLAVNQLKAYLAKELAPIKGQIRSMQLALGSGPVAFGAHGAAGAQVVTPHAGIPARDPYAVTPSDVSLRCNSGGRLPRRKQRAQGTPDPLVA